MCGMTQECSWSGCLDTGSNGDSRTSIFAGCQIRLVRPRSRSGGRWRALRFRQQSFGRRRCSHQFVVEQHGWRRAFVRPASTRSTRAGPAAPNAAGTATQPGPARLPIRKTGSSVDHDVEHNHDDDDSHPPSVKRPAFVRGGSIEPGRLAGFVVCRLGRASGSTGRQAASAAGTDWRLR